jgi:putative hydroxymethylpyrimidine transporter CytX
MNADGKTGTVSQVFLWFGASVSIAEILTGAMLAPLGFTTGMLAILTGHLLGAVILLPAGLIGAKSGLSASESFRISFGRYGAGWLSALNICQLLGWTAVMIVSGAKAFDGITRLIAGYSQEKLWCVLIGGLILVWILVGVKRLFRLNAVIVSALFVSFLILGLMVLRSPGLAPPPEGRISFGAAVELNVAMALSWLPLFSDYTRSLRRPLRGTAFCVLSYCSGSMLMFSIGLGAALKAGTADIGILLASSGLGPLGLFIIAFSTVVTTFLDAHSAGVNAATIKKGVRQKSVSVLACFLGTMLAVAVPMSYYEDFLLFIGSVFSPLFAILFVDFYLFGKRDADYPLNARNMLFWLAGCILYHLLMNVHWLIGSTIPVMLIIGGAHYAACRISPPRR